MSIGIRPVGGTVLRTNFTGVRGATYSVVTPGTYVSLGAMGGFVPSTGSVLYRSSISFSRTDAAGGLGTVTVRVQENGVTILTYMMSASVQNQFASGSGERYMAAARGVTLGTISVAWTADIVMTMNITAPQIVSVIVQDVQD